MANDRCSKWCKPENICAYCRIKDGEQYTSNNYSLKNLDANERMLLFIYACGQDISGYFENNISPIETASYHSEILDERDFSIIFDVNGYKTE